MLVDGADAEHERLPWRGDRRLDALDSDRARVWTVQPGEDPDQLPVLQHALMATFRAWKKDGGKGDIDLPHYEKAGTLADAINRDDLAKVVFRGHAQPAIGPFSPANRFWFDAKLKPPVYSPDAALKALQAEGFRLDNGTLKDRAGNVVVFSIITNSGNKYRERMATMIQQDLQKIGIQVNIVTLDFPSLIERVTQTFDYEAILLGLTNVALDPNEEMNVWLSSSENHQWNPQEKTPETSWEAEIDRLMRLQSASSDPKRRKEAFDRVQEIVVEQAPFIFLVNRNALSASSSSVHGLSPVILAPQTYWNVERLSVGVMEAQSRP